MKSALEVLTPDQSVPPPRRGARRGDDWTRFADRRDAAVIRLFIDTGMRRAELTGLEIDDIDLRLRIAVVTGKGGGRRACPFGQRTARALDRHIRVDPLSLSQGR